MESLKGGADETGRLENEVDETGEPKKMVRQRKRHIINKLRVQMEFYFSSSNLSKDRFMAGLLRNSPYIDLEIFFKFNRIRTLTDDLNLLKKAVEKSPLLELSVDGLKVKRVQEAEMKENEVLCTIYVENVPSHVDHEWVYELFSQYGTIDYISFPRFKNTGRPKGFAFVEFQNPEMADKALEAFGAIGCTISPDMEPSQLQSICTNDNFGVQPENPLGSEACTKGHHVQSRESCESEEQFEEKDLLGDGKTNNEKQKRKEESIENSKKVKLEDCEFGSEKTDGENVKAKKKKLKVDSEITEAPIANEFATECDKKVDECGDLGEKAKGDKETKKRKMKTESDLENAIKRMRKEVDEAKAVTDDNCTESSESLNKRSADENGKEKKLKKQKVKADTTNTSAEEEIMAVEETPSAKVKRKKKKKRKRSKREKAEALEGTVLKVMSKQQWTRVRNRYLNMQKANMGSLKFDLKKRRYPQRMEYENYPTERSVKKGPKFTPDAVIKISFEEPPQDPKKLQEAIKEGGGGGVAYVETSAVEKDVYVRFISADSAAAYIKAGLWSRMMLLSGEEEKEYWNHCASSWLEQRNKKNKNMRDTSHEYPNKIRGREKLLQKAVREAQSNKPSSHVVFEG